MNMFKEGHFVALPFECSRQTALETDFSAGSSRVLDIVVVHNLPAGFLFPLTDNLLQQCILLQVNHNKFFFVPCGSKLLRKTDKKGGESRLFAYSVDSTLHALGDVEPGSGAGEEVLPRYNHSVCPCEEFFWFVARS